MLWRFHRGLPFICSCEPQFPAPPLLDMYVPLSQCYTRLIAGDICVALHTGIVMGFSYQCDACSNYHKDKWAGQKGGYVHLDERYKGESEKRKMSDCCDGKIKTQRNGVDVAVIEWEKWLSTTDGRIVSYLFICHCESSFRAAKYSFLTNRTGSMFPLSFILFNSNNEQQSEDVQQKVGK